MRSKKSTIIWEMPFNSLWQVISVKKAPNGKQKVCLENGLFDHQATLCYMKEYQSLAVVRNLQIESLLRTGSCVFGTPGAVIRYTSDGNITIHRNID